MSQADNTRRNELDAMYAAKQRQQDEANRAVASRMNRAERRARGHRLPILPFNAAQQVAREQGITPQQVTAGYLQHERVARCPECSRVTCDCPASIRQR